MSYTRVWDVMALNLIALVSYCLLLADQYIRLADRAIFDMNFYIHTYIHIIHKYVNL